MPAKTAKQFFEAYALMTDTVERILNAIYRLCGYLASLFIVLIAISVSINIIDRLFGGYTPGTNEFAGYCVGAAGALGLAYTFGQKRHIRMTLLLNRTQGAFRRGIEIISLVIAVGLSCFMSFYLVKMVYVSVILADRSTGTDGILLWIPQAPMALGFLVFSVSLVHTLLNELFSSGSGQDQD